MKPNKKRLGFVVDSEIEELIEMVRNRNNEDKSKMIRTMIYSYIYNHHPDLMGVKWDTNEFLNQLGLTNI